MVLVSVVLAALAVAAFGLDTGLLTGFALAAAAPELFRTDVAQHRLPNRLTYLALLAGIASAGVSWLATGVPPLVPIVAGVAYGGLFLVFALFGGMGMGDVKLAAALGLASPTLTIAVFSPMLTFLSGGVVAVAVLFRRGRAAHTEHIAFGPFMLSGYFGALIFAAVSRLL